MILNRLHLLFAVAVVTIAMALVSCVEIPDKAPDPPVLNAEYRFISVFPDGSTPPTSIKIANGPSFTSYTTYQLGANAVPTNYMTFLSGSKRIVYFNGIVNDTFAVTFETDQRGTLVFARNKKPLTDTSALVSALKLPYRYTFAQNGIADTALVRFTNLLQNAKDTIDVYRSDSTFFARAASPSANNLLLLGTSAAVKVPAAKSYKFFFTNASDTNRVFNDSIVITGASRKVYTVLIYDKYDTTGTTVATKTANVKVKVLEEL